MTCKAVSFGDKRAGLKEIVLVIMRPSRRLFQARQVLGTRHRYWPGTFITNRAQIGGNTPVATQPPLCTVGASSAPLIFNELSVEGVKLLDIINAERMEMDLEKGHTILRPRTQVR